MDGLGTIVDKVAGSVTNVTITSIEKVGYGWKTISIPEFLSSPQGTPSLGGMEYFNVYSLYKVSANVSNQESSAYYGVCKWYRVLTPTLAKDEKERLFRKKIDAAREHLPPISKLESELGLNVRLIDNILFGTPQMRELVDYLAQNPNGLTVSMRTKHGVLPNNLLQKAYNAIK